MWRIEAEMRIFVAALLSFLILQASLDATPRPFRQSADEPQANKIVAEGEIAPAFSSPSQDGRPVSLAQYRGKWVILYFYPKDFTQGCTIEAHNFQKDEAQYQAKNAVVLGVSLDSSDSHRQFCAKEGLNFKLLADDSSEVTKLYASLTEFQGKKYAARNTFIIDPSGVVRKIYRGVKPNGHSQEVLSALSELQQSKA